MRTTTETTTILSTIALLTASPVAALDAPEREVRINQEHFAKLSPGEQQRVLELKSRLEGLMATDRSTLRPAERAALRSEWRDLKREMKQVNAHTEVIYISVGALIIIILLLILLV